MQSLLRKLKYLIVQTLVCSSIKYSYCLNNDLMDVTKLLEDWKAEDSLPLHATKSLKTFLQSGIFLFHARFDYLQESFIRIEKLSAAIESLDPNQTLSQSPKLFISFRFNKEWRTVFLNTTNITRGFVFEIDLYNSTEVYQCEDIDAYKNPLYIFDGREPLCADTKYIDKFNKGLEVDSDYIFSEDTTNKTLISVGYSINITEMPKLIYTECQWWSIRRTQFIIIRISLTVTKNFAGAYKFFTEILEETMNALSHFQSNVPKQRPGFIFYPLMFYNMEDALNKTPEMIYALNFYSALLNMYVKRWSNETINRNIKIMQTPEVTDETTDQPNCTTSLVVLRSPEIYYFPPLLYFETDDIFRPISRICSLRKVFLDLWDVGVTSVVIHFDLLSSIRRQETMLTQNYSEHPTCHAYIGHTEDLELPTFELAVELDIRQNLTQIDSQVLDLAIYLSDTTSIKFSNIKVMIWGGLNASSDVNGTIRNIPIDCIATYDIIYTYITYNNTYWGHKICNETIAKCFTLGLGAPVKTVVWKVNFWFQNIIFLFPTRFELIQKYLTFIERYQIARDLIRQVYTDVKFTLSISFEGICTSVNLITCVDESDILSAYQTSILNLALASNFTVSLEDTNECAIPSFTNCCSQKTWQPLNLNEFPFLVFFTRRLHTWPSRIIEHGAYPCVDIKTFRELKHREIEFHLGYTGVTLTFDLKKEQENNIMTPEEACMLLYYSIGKFSLIQILLSKEHIMQELRMLYEAVSNPSFCSNLRHNEIFNKTVTIDLDLSDSFENFNTLVQAILPVAQELYNCDLRSEISLSGFTSIESNIIENIASHLKNLSRVSKVGLVVNCIKYFQSIWNHENSGDILNITKIDFLICNEKPNQTFLIDSADYTFSKYLYFKKFSEMLYLNKIDLRYRLAYDETNDGLGKILQYVYIFNEFATLTNTQIYMLPAVQDEKSNSLASWWKISNYSLLSDLYAYTDLQSIFFGTESWRPVIKYEFQNESSHTDSRTFAYWIVSSSVGGAGACGVLCVVTGIYYKAKQRARFLTQAEIDEFINGRNEANQTESDSHCFVGFKYLTEFEISKPAINAESKILGSGQFGVVYKGFMEDHGDVAIKIPQDNCPKQTFVGMLSEIKLFSYLGFHDNVVKFLGAYTKEIHKGIVFVAMELCENGSLLSHLQALKSNENLEMHDLFRFAKEIALGMEYIGSKNVIHGDLAARNVLLNSTCTCKISDFGLSRKLYDCQEYVKTTEEPLPWRWMAYESLRRMEFSTQSDVWGYGVTIWEIFSLGDVPYPGRDWSSDFVDELERGLRLSKPYFSEDEIYETMKKCWNIQPVERPNFTTLAQNFVQYLEASCTKILKIPKTNVESNIIYADVLHVYQNSCDDTGSVEGYHTLSDVETTLPRFQGLTNFFYDLNDTEA